MADELQWIEAAMGAVSKISGEVEEDELIGARCPKCESTAFAKISDLYIDAVGRIEENPDDAKVVNTGGMTNLEIVARFPPPRKKSPTILMILLLVPLGIGDYYLYRRFGDLIGQGAMMATLILLAIVFMTSLRRYSDKHYYQRRRRNSLFMCRKCGQLVSSAST
jgi:hypothetical protein